jgi:hypothetical protein
MKSKENIKDKIKEDFKEEPSTIFQKLLVKKHDELASTSPSID